MTETIGPPSAVLADPVAFIVDLVAAGESAPERTVVEDVVRGVTGGRIKQGRLAQSLFEYPQLLVGADRPRRA